MQIDLFDFDLPSDCIADRPCAKRDQARLLHLTASGSADLKVADLPKLLRRGDVVVFNDTRVIPARLLGRRGAVAVETLLHKRLAIDTWEVFARPARRLSEGQTIEFFGGLSADVISRDGAIMVIRFNVAGPALIAALETAGRIPLPPYIQRPDDYRDRTDYQTIYAKRDGAVAAPTAGLHFTPELLAALDEIGVHRSYVTLHVGAGTFLPVKVENITEHKMYAEWGEVSENAANTINRARQAGGRVMAVGTTSLRLLETASDQFGVIHPFADETSLFIVPGYRFKAVDILMTNFHLPRSTLYILVCAFMGLETMRSAYAYAVKYGYRFYSYGDACVLVRGDAL